LRIDERLNDVRKIQANTEYSAFVSLGDDFPVDVLMEITLERSKLHSMVELKARRLRALIQTVQASGWRC